MVRIRLTENVRCIGCGYRLRGLDPAGNCPECGREIAQSLAARDRPGPFGEMISNLCSTFLLLPMCLLALFVAEWDRGLLLAMCALFLAVARYFTVQNIQGLTVLSRWPGMERALVALRAVFVAEIVAATLLAMTAVYLLLTTDGSMRLNQVVGRLSIPGTPWAIAALTSTIPLAWFVFELATAIKSRWWTGLVVGAVVLGFAASAFTILLHLPQHWPFGRITPASTSHLMIAMLVVFGIAVLMILVAAVELEAKANIDTRVSVGVSGRTAPAGTTPPARNGDEASTRAAA